MFFSSLSLFSLFSLSFSLHSSSVAWPPQALQRQRLGERWEGQKQQNPCLSQNAGRAPDHFEPSHTNSDRLKSVLLVSGRDTESLGGFGDSHLCSSRRWILARIRNPGVTASQNSSSALDRKCAFGATTSIQDLNLLVIPVSMTLQLN